MKFITLASVLATAAAFTTSPAAFSSSTVGERAINNVFADGNTHRTRRATIVMDGKANGKLNNRRPWRWAKEWRQVEIFDKIWVEVDGRKSLEMLVDDWLERTPWELCF